MTSIGSSWSCGRLRGEGRINSPNTERGYRD
jgi:hypothetical protein